MARIEKTVFISYRRTNMYTARAVYQNLMVSGFDCFFDVDSIGPGEFEQIILGQIKARAHFVLILTPSTLERCSDPNDWLRREIECALESQRNIVPLIFDGFDYSNPSIKKLLTGKLDKLQNYNAASVPTNYFDEAMERVKNRFLNTPLVGVLHPTTVESQKYIQQQKSNTEALPLVTQSSLQAEALLDRGKQRTDPYQAIANYDDAIRLMPDYAEAYYYRGTAFWELGDLEKSINN
jgi:hypothetical protein